jgi:hypothetical protein
VTPGDDPIAIGIRVGEILDAIGVRHTIGGSIAASFAGEPRSTGIIATGAAAVNALYFGTAFEIGVGIRSLPNALMTLCLMTLSDRF